MEWTFLADQRNERKMICEDFVDRQWMKTMERRKKDIESWEKMRVEDEKERHRNQPVPTFEDSASEDTEVPSQNQTFQTHRLLVMNFSLQM